MRKILNKFNYFLLLFALISCGANDEYANDEYANDEYYVLFVYPDKNYLFVDMTLDGIADLEQCRLEAKKYIDAMVYENADYECRTKCVSNPDPGVGLGDSYICEETKR